MTLIIKKGLAVKRGILLTPNFNYDPDAATYIKSVETADGQSLEPAVKYAINDFVIGCKQDGIWSAVKACCILAGARTLSGCLVPLVGAAPTNNNFVSGDYNRKTGLVGDGSTKYLDSNRNNNADPQNSNHNSVYVTSNPTSLFMGVGIITNEIGCNNLGYAQGAPGNRVFFRNRSSISLDIFGTLNLGFIGHSRQSSTSIVTRFNSGTLTNSSTSQTPRNANVILWSNETRSFYAASRLAFYSIGTSLDLTLLDNRVTQLMNTLSSVIP